MVVDDLLFGGESLLGYWNHPRFLKGRPRFLKGRDWDPGEDVRVWPCRIVEKGLVVEGE